MSFSKENKQERDDLLRRLDELNLLHKQLSKQLMEVVREKIDVKDKLQEYEGSAATIESSSSCEGGEILLHSSSSQKQKPTSNNSATATSISSGHLKDKDSTSSDNNNSKTTDEMIESEIMDNYNMYCKKNKHISRTDASNNITVEALEVAKKKENNNDTTTTGIKDNNKNGYSSVVSDAEFESTSIGCGEKEHTRNIDSGVMTKTKKKNVNLVRRTSDDYNKRRISSEEIQRLQLYLEYDNESFYDDDDDDDDDNDDHHEVISNISNERKGDDNILKEKFKETTIDKPENINGCHDEVSGCTGEREDDDDNTLKQKINEASSDKAEEVNDGHGDDDDVVSDTNRTLISRREDNEVTVSKSNNKDNETALSSRHQNDDDDDDDGEDSEFIPDDDELCMYSKIKRKANKRKRKLSDYTLLEKDKGDGGHGVQKQTKKRGGRGSKKCDNQNKEDNIQDDYENISCHKQRQKIPVQKRDRLKKKKKKYDNSQHCTNITKEEDEEKNKNKKITTSSNKTQEEKIIINHNNKSFVTDELSNETKDVGTRVYARWNDDDFYYAGVITEKKKKKKKKNIINKNNDDDGDGDGDDDDSSSMYYYSISFDDGDYLDDICCQHVWNEKTYKRIFLNAPIPSRSAKKDIGSNVCCYWTDGEFYKGIITSRYKRKSTDERFRYSIKFDDGDTVTNVKCRLVWNEKLFKDVQDNAPLLSPT